MVRDIVCENSKKKTCLNHLQQLHKNASITVIKLTTSNSAPLQLNYTNITQLSALAVNTLQCVILRCLNKQPMLDRLRMQHSGTVLYLGSSTNLETEKYGCVLDVNMKLFTHPLNEQSCQMLLFLFP